MWHCFICGYEVICHSCWLLHLLFLFSILTAILFAILDPSIASKSYHSMRISRSVPMKLNALWLGGQVPVEVVETDYQKEVAFNTAQFHIGGDRNLKKSHSSSCFLSVYCSSEKTNELLHLKNIRWNDKRSYDCLDFLLEEHFYCDISSSSNHLSKLTVAQRPISLF